MGRGRGRETQLEVAVVTGPLHAKGGMSKIFTFHAIVGKSFTELIDHNEEDAQGIPKDTLTKRNSEGVKYVLRWPIFTNEC